MVIRSLSKLRSLHAVQIVISSAFESSIGLAAGAQLAATLQSSKLAHGLGTLDWFAADAMLAPGSDSATGMPAVMSVHETSQLLCNAAHGIHINPLTCSGVWTPATPKPTTVCVSLSGTVYSFYLQSFRRNQTASRLPEPSRFAPAGSNNSNQPHIQQRGVLSLSDNQSPEQRPEHASNDCSFDGDSDLQSSSIRHLSNQQHQGRHGRGTYNLENMHEPAAPSNDDNNPQQKLSSSSQDKQQQTRGQRVIDSPQPEQMQRHAAHSTGSETHQHDAAGSQESRGSVNNDQESKQAHEHASGTDDDSGHQQNAELRQGARQMDHSDQDPKQMHEHASRTDDDSGHQQHAELCQAGRPTVLFLHGFLGTGEDWAPIAQALSAQYHCVTVDLPGHGKTNVTSQWEDDVLEPGQLCHNLFPCI